jgi:hypothetical protein
VDETSVGEARFRGAKVVDGVGGLCEGDDLGKTEASAGVVRVAEGEFYSARVSMNHLVSCFFVCGITLQNDTPCF